MYRFSCGFPPYLTALALALASTIKMGRRSKMSKLRSERMHAWWQHQRAAGVQVAEKFTCEESKKSLAAVISHKSIQPKNESVSSNSGDDRASLYSAGGSDGSADFDVSPEALKRDLRDLASLNKGHGLRRRQYVRRRGSQREPLDKSIPEECMLIRLFFYTPLTIHSNLFSCLE